MDATKSYINKLCELSVLERDKQVADAFLKYFGIPISSVFPWEIEHIIMISGSIVKEFYRYRGEEFLYVNEETIESILESSLNRCIKFRFR